MADDNNEYAAASLDDPKLAVKEGDDIDYTIILWFYLAADLRKFLPPLLTVFSLFSYARIWPPASLSSTGFFTPNLANFKYGYLCVVMPQVLAPWDLA
jgi:hypothetical protein